MFAALDDVERRGATSKTSGPVHVWVLEDGRPLLVDGHHRLVEKLLRNDLSPIESEVVGEGYSDYYATPTGSNVFRFTSSRFGGLESLADDAILERAAQRLA